MNHPTEQLASFTPGTRATFLQHLHENPHNRRVTQTDKELLTEWLTDPHKQPLSQKEFSRRNYVLRTFLWDEQTQNILVSAKTEGEKHRLVVTEDKIADVVEFVHESNQHGGWDATWKDISNSYYGILRSDVIHLLKQCQICALNPTKRPKGSAATRQSLHLIHDRSLDLLSTSGNRKSMSPEDIQEVGQHSTQ
ncbi:MAG: hypothetical protein Q9210_004876 [Variospora velana]